VPHCDGGIPARAQDAAYPKNRDRPSLFRFSVSAVAAIKQMAIQIAPELQGT
jgi:hypothetical protein